MIYFIIAFLLISILLVVILEKKIVNPIVIFAGVWTLVIFLSSLRLYNMIEYSEKILRIISEGIIAFVLGAFIMMYGVQKKIRTVKRKNIMIFLNIRILNGLILISLIMVFLLSIKVVILLKNGTKL